MTDHAVTEEDIARLVPEFYERVRRDELLGPIFDGAIKDWPHHIAKLQDFWSSVMLTSGRYKGQPMVAHVRHEQQMSKEAFARWLALWAQTSRDLLSEETAAAVQDRAARIAESLQLGIQFYRDRKAA
nr:group III truncated hemoglobin [uncultured Sphingomonas sp.]